MNNKPDSKHGKHGKHGKYGKYGKCSWWGESQTFLHRVDGEEDSAEECDQVDIHVR